MKKMFPKIICCCISILFCQQVLSQSITDHTGNDVLTLYTIKKFSTGITNKSLSIAYTGDSKKNVEYYFLDSPDTTPIYHLQKSYRSPRFSFAVSNISESYDKFFSELNQPSFDLNLGMVVSNVTSILDWHRLQQVVRVFPLIPKTYDLYFGAYVNTSLIKYWDTTNQVLLEKDEAVIEFLRPGVRLTGNLYYSPKIMISFNGSLDYGQPTSGFKAYQGNVPATIGVQPTGQYIIDIGRAEGKYGGAIEKKFNGRVSLGMPLFIGNIFVNPSMPPNFLHQIFVMPHYSPYGSSREKCVHVVGTTFNLTSKMFGRKDARLVPSAGVGIDWKTGSNTVNGWTTALYYITGTINLGTIDTKTPEKIQQQGIKHSPL